MVDCHRRFRPRSIDGAAAKARAPRLVDRRRCTGLRPLDTVRPNPLGTKTGYNPYDSGKLGKTPAPPRKKDLRRLSEFLKLKKQADGNKDEEE